MPDNRAKRAKVWAMALRGTDAEAAVAKLWLAAHPAKLLGAEDILAVDDSNFGPSEDELDAALAAYGRREYAKRST